MLVSRNASTSLKVSERINDAFISSVGRFFRPAGRKKRPTEEEKYHAAAGDTEPTKKESALSQLFCARSAVSDPKDGPDIAWLGRVGLDLLAQIANMNIDRALDALVVVALEALQQQLA